MKNNKSMGDPLQIIVGVIVISGGFLYLINKGSWGLVVVSIGLLMEAMKNRIR